MKTDDPRLEQTRNEALKKAKEYQNLVLAVNIYYPKLDKSLNEFLDASGRKYGEREPMAAKLKRCKEEEPEQIGPADWKVVGAAVELRNELDHRNDPVQVQLRMNELRTAYLDALSPIQRESEKEQSDAHIAEAAYQLCIGHFVVAAETVEASRKDS